MGWASGSELAEEIWDIVRPYIPNGDQGRKLIARDIIEAFENHDCDTMDECEQLQEDAQLPQTCWDCGEEFDYGTLNSDGLCKECEETNG